MGPIARGDHRVRTTATVDQSRGATPPGYGADAASPILTLERGPAIGRRSNLTLDSLWIRRHAIGRRLDSMERLEQTNARQVAPLAHLSECV